MERHELTVTAEAAGCRLDKGLALLAPELSRSQIQTVAEKGSILKNGAAAGKKDTLREGDSIIITLPDPVPTGTQAENIPLEIVYEDDDLLVEQLELLADEMNGSALLRSVAEEEQRSDSLKHKEALLRLDKPTLHTHLAPVLCIVSIRIPAGC